MQHECKHEHALDNLEIQNLTAALQNMCDKNAEFERTIEKLEDHRDGLLAMVQLLDKTIDERDNEIESLVARLDRIER